MQWCGQIDRSAGNCSRQKCDSHLSFNSDVEEVHFETDGNCGGRDHEWCCSVECALQNFGVARGAKQGAVGLDGVLASDEQNDRTNAQCHKDCE